MEVSHLQVTFKAIPSLSMRKIVLGKTVFSCSPSHDLSLVFIFLDFHGSQSSLNSIDDEWDDIDDTFTADYSSDEDTRSVSSNCSIPVACVALYNFEVCTVYAY